MSSTTSSDPKKDGSSHAATTSSTIQLDTMSLDQLNSLKQREESRLQALSQRYSALRQAAARINAAKNAVRELYDCDSTSNHDVSSKDTTLGDSDTKEDGGEELPTTKDVFVPLTESVYVPGKIRIRQNVLPPSSDVDKNDTDEPLLLVELGTGYFVEQNTTATTDYLQRKLSLVDANSDNGMYSRVFSCVNV